MASHRSTSAARTGALLVAMVLAGLWFHEVHPQLEDRTFAWPGHAEPFHLPTYLPGDCPFYRATAESILRDADLDLHNNVAWNVLSPQTQVALGARGEWYPKHPIAMALAALPFYAALGDAGLLLFNLLQTAALDLIIFLLARRYASDAVSLATALLFAFGTLLRPAAYNFSPDVFSSLLVAAGVLALLERRCVMAGVLLSLAVAAKWTNLPFLPLAAIWTLATLGARPALRFSLAAAPALLALGGLNAHMFGSPLVTPYDRVMIMSGGREVLEPSHRNLFSLPFFATLWKQIVDPVHGLLRSAPPLLLALPGFALLFRHARSEAALLLALCLAQVAIFAPYKEWSASSYGHRFLLSAVVLSAAPVAALLAFVLGEQSRLRE